jgi:myosin heavy subunit
LTESCLSNDDTAEIEEKVLLTNSVLEAFGNANTIRNHNSSRFGKWIQVKIDVYGSIEAAFIQNYLLEKSRVAFQDTNERK